LKHWVDAPALANTAAARVRFAAEISLSADSRARVR
jgi:hypothetical protein